MRLEGRFPRRAALLVSMLASVCLDCLKVFDINIRQQYYDAAILDWSFHHCDILKINEDEVALIQFYTKGSAEPKELAKLLRDRFGIQYLIITKGGDGCIVCAANQEPIFEKCPEITVCNTVGAGDAFTAGFITSLLREKPMHICAKNANSVGAYVASCDSATPELNLELL